MTSAQSAPATTVQPAPTTAVLPRDTTGSLLDSPSDGGYYSGSTADAGTGPITTPQSPVYQTPTVSTPTASTPAVSTPSPVYQTPTVNTPMPTTTTTPVLPVPTVSPPKSTTAAVPTYNYIGCYTDTSTRALPIQAPNAMTIAECKAVAASKGSAYFGLQWPEGNSGGKAQCWYGPGVYGRYGTSSVCKMTDANNNKIGGDWANAVYRV